MIGAELALPSVAASGHTALHASSAAAQAILDLMTLSFLVCALIFALVAGAVFWCVVRYRWREAEGEAEPVQTTGNRRLELAWTAGPLLLLIGLFTLTARAMRTADPPAVGEPDLVVIGHQWWWEARYAGSGNSGGGFVTANEIHIPVGKRLLVRIEAADVIHDFWVPELARKVDAIPGHPNSLWLEADKAGAYAGACAEYCGAEHAWMRFEVIADAPADYATWARAEKATDLARRAAATPGARLFRGKTCSNCHELTSDLAAAAAQTAVAPNLAHVGSRRMLAGGAAQNTPALLARWLQNPAAIKPSVRMPNLGLNDDEAHELATYLESLE